MVDQMGNVAMRIITWLWVSVRVFHILQNRSITYYIVKEKYLNRSSIEVMMIKHAIFWG